MIRQNIIKAPRTTEKVTSLTERHNQVVFEVALDATKNMIRLAVQALYPSISVVDVRTLIIPSRLKRRGNSVGRVSKWKKAIVTLKEGDKIDFHGVE